MNRCIMPEAEALPMQALAQELLQISRDIRQVAVSCSGRLVRAQRAGLMDNSSSEGETFEERVLNPTLLTMVSQHGRVNRGGCVSVVVRYGDIEVLLIPVTSGYVSLGLELNAHPIEIRERVRRILDEKLRPSEQRRWFHGPLVAIE